MRRILFMPFFLLTILCFGQHTDSLQLDLKPILENSAPVCGLVSPLPQTVSFQAILEGKVEGPVIRMGCSMGRVATLNYRPLYVLDGRVIESKASSELDPNDIERIHVLKGDDASEKYGDAGRGGVVEIFSKSDRILYVVDGIVTNKADLKALGTACVDEIIVLKNTPFGCSPPKTVILITTKTVLF